MATTASSCSLLVCNPYAAMWRSRLSSRQRYGVRGSHGREMMQMISEYGVCESCSDTGQIEGIGHVCLSVDVCRDAHAQVGCGGGVGECTDRDEVYASQRVLAHRLQVHVAGGFDWNTR